MFGWCVRDACLQTPAGQPTNTHTREAYRKGNVCSREWHRSLTRSYPAQCRRRPLAGVGTRTTCGGEPRHRRQTLRSRVRRSRSQKRPRCRRRWPSTAAGPRTGMHRQRSTCDGDTSECIEVAKPFPAPRPPHPAGQNPSRSMPDDGSGQRRRGHMPEQAQRHRRLHCRLQ